MKETFVKFIQKDKQVITFANLRDHIKNKSVFKGRAKLTTYVKDKLLMRLIELKFCTMVGDKIIINPRIK